MQKRFETPFELKKNQILKMIFCRKSKNKTFLKAKNEIVDDCQNFWERFLKIFLKIQKPV